MNKPNHKKVIHDEQAQLSKTHSPTVTSERDLSDWNVLQNNLLFTVDETEVCLSFPESHAIKQSCNMGFLPEIEEQN